MLRAFVNAERDDWADWLHLLEFAYNSMVHSSTGTPPFKLLLGFLPRSGLDMLLAPYTPSSKDVPRRDSEEFLEQLRMHREHA
ncbi:hypothetical protein CPC08DRAFT_619652, partial [Agrocybe pediades]